MRYKMSARRKPLKQRAILATGEALRYKISCVTKRLF
jgi:hypothetical protein